MTTSALPTSAATGRADAAPVASATEQKIPRISVVLPAYNAQRFILKSVNSVLSQTFADFECIIIDDGSTDRTASMIGSLARRDPRVKQLAVPHGGIVAALNAGVTVARGEFIARMDADDVCLPARFARQVEFLDAHPDYVAVGSKVMLTDPYDSSLWEIDVQSEHEEIDKDLMRGNGWALFHPTALIRRKALLQVGAYRPEYQWSEDIDLFLRLSEIGKLANLQEALLRYRQHFSSVNRTKLEIQLRRSEAVLTEAYRRRGLTAPSAFNLDLGPRLTEYDQTRAWCQRALIIRNLSAARRHALAMVRLAPMKYEPWTLVYHAFSGR
jgi:glycosyltransferase involved in cell wall biosynthesis